MSTPADACLKPAAVEEEAAAAPEETDEAAPPDREAEADALPEAPEADPDADPEREDAELTLARDMEVEPAEPVTVAEPDMRTGAAVTA